MRSCSVCAPSAHLMLARVGNSVALFAAVFVLPTFFAIERPVLADTGFEVRQETLPNTAVTNQWASFNFVTTFASAPLVFAIPTNQGGDPCAIRLNNVTASGFEASCLEPAGEDGTHIAMDFHFLAIEPGVYDLPLVGGGMLTVEAGFVDTTAVQHRCGAGCGTTSWESIGFDPRLTSGLSGPPSVLTQIQGMANETNTGAAPSSPFLTTVAASGSTSTTGFQVALERSEAGSGSVTNDERIGWLAMPAGSTCHTLDLGGGATALFEAAVTGTVFNGWDNGCNGSHSFSCGFSASPLLIGSKSSRQGIDGGWTRRCSLSNTSASFSVDEDRENDNERNHTNEEVSLVAFSAPISTTLPSYTLISELILDRSGRGALGWQTSGETGAASYQLWARRPNGEWRQVGSRPIPALMSSPQGAHYQVDLDGMNVGPGTEFAFVERSVMGEQRYHGPFIPRMGILSDPARTGSKASGFVAKQRWPTGVVQGPSPDRFIKSIQAPTEPDIVNIEVLETGLHGIPLSRLAEVFDRTEEEISNLASSGKLDLSLEGEPIAWSIDRTHRRLMFFGQQNEDPLRPHAVYRLRHSVQGVSMERSRVSSAGVDGGSFVGRAQFERNNFFVTALPIDPSWDLWMWQGFHSGQPDWAVGQFDFDLEGPEVGAPARLVLVFQGASRLPQGSAHRLAVEINGHLLEELSLGGLDRTSLELDVPGSYLRAAGNQLRIEALPAGPEGQASLFFLDRFEVLYERSYRSEQAHFRFHSTAGDGVVVSTPSAPGGRPYLFSLQDPRRPRRLWGFGESEVDGRSVVSFRAREGGDYLLTHNTSAIEPGRIWGAYPENLREHSGAEHLVIAPAAWSETAWVLSGRRRADGLSVATIRMEEIYEQFSFGHQDPRALGELLRFAYRNWPIKPRYVVLAGDGHLDYQGHLEAQGAGGGYPNPIPPRLVSTSEGIYSSDGISADFNGDGIPELAVGRLPVSSEDELEAWLDKLAVWEDSAGAWKSEALWVTDVPDGGGSFRGVARSFDLILTAPAAGLATDSSPGPPLWRSETLAVDELGAQGTREALLHRWRSGAGLVTWIGHGASDRWATDGVLTEADLEMLDAEQRSSIVTVFGCNTNRFELPGFSSLGGSLTLHPDGGAIAVLASSGATRLGQLYGFGTGWNDALRGAKDPEQRLGDRMLQAWRKAKIASRTALASETAAVFVLFGDPATRLPY